MVTRSILSTGAPPRQGANAAVEFQKVIDHGAIAVPDPMGALAGLQFARALVLAGEKTKAQAAYRDFLALWSHADADNPIMVKYPANAAIVIPSVAIATATFAERSSKTEKTSVNA